MKSAYIHIPFCHTICSYCDFCKMFYQPKWVHDYLICLKEEISDRYQEEEIKTLYIGGGTPSCLSTQELEYLFQITNLFQKSPHMEFTIECNVNDLTEEKLDLFSKYAITRLSIGIQSFQEKKQIIMGRKHDFEEVEKKIKMVRQKGFSNLNIDLIYGFPNETLKDLKEDLKLILKLNPEHVSTYGLILSEHTLLHINKVNPMDEEVELKCYNEICKALKKKKYYHYEVSNFAKKGYESLHNLNYWNNEEYYGFGLSASGYIDSIRYTNTFSLTKYFKKDYDKEKEFLSKKDKMDLEMMLGLRKIKGIHIGNFEKKYKISLKDTYPIEPLLKKKELIQKKGYLFINPSKLYVMNEILIKLI